MKRLVYCAVAVAGIVALLLGALAEDWTVPGLEIEREPLAEAVELFPEAQDGEAVPAGVDAEAGEVCAEALEASVSEAEAFELGAAPEAPEPYALATPEEAQIAAPEAQDAAEGPITLYFLSAELQDRIALPEGAQTGCQIQAQPGATFEIKNMTGDTFFKPALFLSGFGYVCPQFASDRFGNGTTADEVVIVREGEDVREISFHIIDYERVYAESVMERYLATEITPDMTDLEKLAKITEICARDFDYNGEVSGYVYMICYGGADCWGSTSFICRAGQALGLDVRGRDARSDPGAGSGHMNVAAVIDGQTYIAEAGYDQAKPRSWDVRLEGGAIVYSNSRPVGGEYDATSASADILSVQLDTLRVRLGEEASFSVSSGPAAKYLYLYDESGAQLESWQASARSAVSQGTRLWRVKHAFDRAGLYTLRFRTSTDGDALSPEMTLAVEVRDDANAVVSAAFASERVAVNQDVRLNVKTGRDVRYLYAYDERGEVERIWYVSGNQVGETRPNSRFGVSRSSSSTHIVDGLREWSFITRLDAVGLRRLTLRPAMTREGALGTGQDVVIEVTYLYPYSISLMGNNYKEGSAMSATVIAPEDAEKLLVQDDAGAAVAEFSRSSSSTSAYYGESYSSARSWTLLNAFAAPAPGEHTWTLYCCGEDGNYGPGEPFSFTVVPASTPAPTPAPAKDGSEDTALHLRGSATQKLKAGEKLSVVVDIGKVKSWTSGNKAVATVSKKGMVTARAAGTAKLTATLTSGGKLVLTVKVTDVNAPKSVAILNGKSAKLKVGKKLQLRAAMSPANANGSLTWTSSNAKVVTVSSKGKLTAKAAGTARVTVKTQNGKKAVIKVKVTKR